jgi:hypothetical protein
MQACIDVKHDITKCSYAMNRLMSYMMDKFTDPRQYQDPNNRYVVDGRFKGSDELVNATRQILHSGSKYSPAELQWKGWTNEQWLALLNHVPPVFKEPVFIIAILKYLLAREQVRCDVTLINHDGTFKEFHDRYGHLISLAF